MKPNKLRLLGVAALSTLVLLHVAPVIGLMMIFFNLGIAILTPEDESCRCVEKREGSSNGRN